MKRVTPLGNSDTKKELTPGNSAVVSLDQLLEVPRFFW